jgi:DNA-binding MarR family transcriptional regulator
MSTPRAGRTARREAAADEPASGEAETGPGREGLLEEGALSQVLGYHVVQASLTTLGLFARHVGEPLGLRPVEFSLLLILQANDRVTPKQLAQALALSAPNLTILLDRLQERGVIERVRSDSDRRSQHVLLTESGLALAHQCKGLCATMEADLDDCLTPGEHLLLIELLQKVARHGRSR